MDPMFWPILLLVLGLGFVILEFLVPSSGVLSLLAAASIIGALALAFMADIRSGVIMLGLTTVLIPLVIAAGVRWWPHTPIGRLVLIARPEHPDEVLPETEEYRGLTALIGLHGTAKTKMLPSGTVVIQERSYDAVSEGMPIEHGQTIRVVDVRTNRIVVRPVEGSPPAAEPTSPDEILSQPIDSLGLDDTEE